MRREEAAKVRVFPAAYPIRGILSMAIATPTNLMFPIFTIAHGALSFVVKARNLRFSETYCI
jgi:hypothetical protein